MMATDATLALLSGLSTEELMKISLERGESVLAANGALSVTTGNRTGRSPKDRFIVVDEITKDSVDWGEVNRPIELEKFSALWHKAEKHLKDKESFSSMLHVGASSEHYLPVHVITELAWHNAFCHLLFIRATNYNPHNKKEWTLLNAATLLCDPESDGVNSETTIMINIKEQKVLLCGSLYAGEMKKAMFTILNFILPERDILPMHCAANMGKDGKVALFFGLSGTGKTTLSADPNRSLIGDDEHGWSKDSAFNFEGGCYAKCIDLSKEKEPVIWDAISSGAIMENVILDESGQPDFSDVSLTQNTRAAYPREHIKGRVLDNRGSAPSAVVFLTCDLFGVLPPVSILTKAQAAYHFLSGYTALVGSTEVGSAAGISSTFSTCFGAPFFPRSATIYADLLLKRMNDNDVPVYLVNTGWTGGSYGQGGKRFAIPVSRAIISAILSGEINKAETQILPGFKMKIPTALEGVDSVLLDPRLGWTDIKEYNQTLNKLIDLFKDNIKKHNVSDAILNAGPVHLDV